MSNNRKILFTMDLDWTSEAVISNALEFLMNLEIPCVIFQTHSSKCLNELNSRQFHLEIHPNFFNGSDHGNTVEEIFDYFKSINYTGKVIRAHKYFMPDKALRQVTNMSYRYTMNRYTDLELKKPFKINDRLTELNTFFEDGMYVKQKHPFRVEYTLDRIINNGIYVFNIHPIHIAFNSRNYKLTRDLKDNMPKEEYREISDEFITKNKFNGYGIRDYIRDLVHALRLRGDDIITIDQVSV